MVRVLKVFDVLLTLTQSLLQKRLISVNDFRLFQSLVRSKPVQVVLNQLLSFLPEMLPLVILDGSWNRNPLGRYFVGSQLLMSGKDKDRFVANQTLLYNMYLRRMPSARVSISVSVFKGI